jgi:hypothetical protein
MKLGFYNFYDVYNHNRMFDPSFHAEIGDDLLYPLHELARVGKERGHSITTIDTEPLDSYDAIAFFDYPGKDNVYLKKLIDLDFKNLYLFLFENPIIKPDNYNPKNYISFKKVFSYKDDIIDNKKVFKTFVPEKIPVTIPMNTNRPKFCCMIAGNKMNLHPGQLYSERVRAIRWFEKHQPDKFDLYGKGWDEPYLPVFLRKFVFPSLFKAYYPYPPSYRGELDSKRKTLEQYKFSICYENLRDCPGYITEKIFDSFFAGCIPVYLGANNITDYIPDSTFIDKRYFKDYERLFSYMNQITEGEHRRYLGAIQKFIQSEQIVPFSTETFVNQILTEMTATT